MLEDYPGDLQSNLRVSLKDRPYIDKKCAPSVGYPFLNFTPRDVDSPRKNKPNFENLWQTFTEAVTKNVRSEIERSDKMQITKILT